MTPEEVSAALDKVRIRCEVARLSGGIAFMDVLEGKKVPKDWKLDPVTSYYLPPNIIILSD